MTTKYEIKTRARKYALLETATEQVIAIADKARDLRKLKSNLESGMGFDGNTPRFLLSSGPFKVLP